jgi:molybdate transport system ATP-binding protein
MMAPEAFLELAGVSLRLNDRLVFRNTHWTFARNQNWALIGPNGAGKSVLACSLAGELPIVKGDILYGFHTPAGRLPEDCIVLVSFEKQKALSGEAPPAIRWFSAGQEEAAHVEQFLSQDSVEEINPFEIKSRSSESAVLFERLRRRVLSLLDVSDLMARSLPSLSNGEMRKILLAHALLKRPRLLILDDAFGGLDTHFRSHLKEVLERIMSHGTVRMLLVESQPSNLPDNITHILYVDGLRVVAQGPRQEMMRHPGIRALIHSAGTPIRSRKSKSLSSTRQSENREKLVQMENVTVQYDNREILSAIYWTIRRGESWALIGPNGSGKSTLLSLMSGDNPQAYANTVAMFGRRRGSGGSVWDLKRRIGLISPELHLHFPQDQTCLETVISGFHESMGCYRPPSSQQYKMAQNVLARFGLSRFSTDFFGSLSAGLQRMTLLARALVKVPDLLLLDEPCQGLDGAHRNKFLNIIESLLSRSETTIVYVTHIFDEIPKGIHKILQLSNGRIVQSGTIQRNRKIVI